MSFSAGNIPRTSPQTFPSISACVPAVWNCLRLTKYPHLVGFLWCAGFSKRKPAPGIAKRIARHQPMADAMRMRLPYSARLKALHRNLGSNAPRSRMMPKGYRKSDRPASFNRESAPAGIPAAFDPFAWKTWRKTAWDCCSPPVRRFPRC